MTDTLKKIRRMGVAYAGNDELIEQRSQRRQFPLPTRIHAMTGDQLADEYELIQAKKSKLSRMERENIVEQVNKLHERFNKTEVKTP